MLLNMSYLRGSKLLLALLCMSLILPVRRVNGQQTDVIGEWIYTDQVNVESGEDRSVAYLQSDAIDFGFTCIGKMPKAIVRLNNVSDRMDMIVPTGDPTINWLTISDENKVEAQGPEAWEWGPEPYIYLSSGSTAWSIADAMLNGYRIAVYVKNGEGSSVANARFSQTDGVHEVIKRLNCLAP